MKKDLLNKEFIKHIENILGDDAPNYFSALDNNTARGLLVNISKHSVEHFKNISNLNIKATNFNTFGFYLNSCEKVGNNPLHIAGAFYMQEPSAMAPISALPKINGYILDCCASPGGKTIQLALANPNSIIVANEIDRERCNVLISNIERIGLTNIYVSCLPGEKLNEYFYNFFDAVIVDAPCSGEGMFRKDDFAIKQWTKEYSKKCSILQKEILNNVIPCLKGNGILLYSTCTFSVNEDEENVEFIKYKYNFNLIEMKKLFPHKIIGEGQFYAILKSSNKNFDINNLSNKKISKLLKNSKNIEICKQFLEYNLKNVTFPYFLERNNCVFGFNDILPLTRYQNFENIGVRLGSVENNRFIPHHQLFKSFGQNFNQFLNFSLADAKLFDYISGNSLINENFHNGYIAILVEGYPLGGAKVANDRINNLFPKGLRV